MVDTPVKVMFVGKLVSESDRKGWAATARALGEAAAESEVHLVLASDAIGTLERGVLEGAARFARLGGRSPTWEIHEPADGRSRFRRPSPELREPVRRHLYPRGSSRWYFAHLAALDSSDAVIAMGGHANTKRVCRAAFERNTPCAPLPFYGGTAAEEFERMTGPESDLEPSERRMLDAIKRPWPADLRTKEAHWLIGMLVGLVRRLRRRRVYFICYSRKNVSEADHVEVELRRYKRGVLRDEVKFVPGSSLPAQMQQAIASADDFLVVDSKHAASSGQVSKEITIAKQLRQATKRPVRVVGVLLEGAPPRTSIDPNDIHVDGQTRAQRTLGVKLLVDTE